MKLKYLTLILVLFGFSSCLEAQCENFTRERFVEFNYSGVITDKFIDNKNRATPTIILKGRSHEIYSDELYNYIVINDSIRKNRGSLEILVYRDSSVSVFYPECGDRLIMDDTTIIRY